MHKLQMPDNLFVYNSTGFITYLTFPVRTGKHLTARVVTSIDSSSTSIRLELIIHILLDNVPRTKYYYRPEMFTA